ncbi:hypothetical protein LC55x_1277 [Lysobacter capsici]|nr:hypothetical protein LC55x_1277 [Lysobacter capsici]
MVGRGRLFGKVWGGCGGAWRAKANPPWPPFYKGGNPVGGVDSAEGFAGVSECGSAAIAARYESIRGGATTKAAPRPERFPPLKKGRQGGFALPTRPIRPHTCIIAALRRPD